MMAWFLSFINPLTLVQRLIGAAIGVVVLSGLLWWAHDSIGDTREAQVVARYQAAEALATQQNKQREADNLAKTQKAHDEKIKTLELNLAAASRANAAGQRLRDALRAGEGAAQTNLATCVQRARALSGLLESSAELARRISKEADGHVADKVACAAAWPK